MQFSGHNPAAALALIASLVTAWPATAQDTLQEADAGSSADALDDGYRPPPGMEVRVITAGESESAGDLSAGDSITGFDAADLDALGALSVADLGQFTPNLEIVTAGATSPTFFIRGVGLNDFNSNAAGSVAVYQDDVALNAPALQLGTLFDTSNVNILRGPVGSGPYRNASAGAIKLYSAKPNGDYNAYLRSQFGNFNSIDFEGALEMPIYQDYLSARLAFRVSERDGYMRNGCGGFPLAGRAVNPSGAETSDRPYSLCGENVPGLSVSPIADDAPIHVNDLGNWATRGMFRFQPTLDTDLLFNFHIAQRDQLSTQGISYGVRGDQYDPNTNDNTIVLRGRLGAQDGQGDGTSSYQRPAVADMIQRLRLIHLNEICPPGSPPCDNVTSRNALDLAELQVADEIATNLDNDPWSGDYNRVGQTKNDTWGSNVQANINLPHDMILRSVSAYDSYDRLIDADTDQSPNQLFEIKTTDQGWQFFQDLELTGGFRKDGTLDWDVGGFYLQEELDVRVDNEFGDATAFLTAEREYTQTLKSFGAYARLTWTFLENFTLDGGARYNWERKAIDYFLRRAGVPLTDNQVNDRGAPTGDIRLTYNFREDTHVYWKYTRGWKGGHYNATGSLRKGVTYTEPEQNDAFEAGLRGMWFDSRIAMDLTFFYYDYQDYQLFTVEQDFGSLPEFVVINASNVENFGAEVDFTTRPWDGAVGTLRFGWLEGKFTDFVQTQTVQEDLGNGPVVRQVELNFSGNRLLNAPQFKVSLTGEQTVSLGRFGSLTARYDAAWSDVTYFDATEGRGLPNEDGEIYLPENTIAQAPYWLHNIVMIYQPPGMNFEIQGWVRNISNKAYKSFAFDAAGFQKTTIYFLGEPRMWGMTLHMSF